MRKKIISALMAMALTFSLGTSAMATESQTTWTGGDAPTADVNAKIELDTSIAATVTWGDMNFTYTEAARTWTGEGNSITVRNTSPHSAIDVSYTYNDTTSSNRNALKFFTSNISSFAVGTSSADEGTVTGANSGIGISETGTIYTMFTGDTEVNELSTGDFAKVGSVTITISSH